MKENIYKKEKVSIVKCCVNSSDEEIAKSVYSAVNLIGGCEPILNGKQKILIKPNIGTNSIRLYKGRQVDLTEPAIVDSVIALIREHSEAEIMIGDGEPIDLYQRLGYDNIVKKYHNVRLVDFGAGPFERVSVPNPVMFRNYMLSNELKDVDMTISISKMKIHHAQGATLCLKNLFGLTPKAIYGSVRLYLHDALVRLPRVLVDLGLIFRPELCLIDGLVSANNQEWGGEPVEMNVILAGYNAIATDAVGMKVMGLDPKSDYPNYPFFYHNNPLNIAKSVGLGTNDLEDIEILGYQIDEVKKQFEVKINDMVSMINDDFKQKGKLQVNLYRKNRVQFVKDYAGKYIGMGEGKVLWATSDIDEAIRNCLSYEKSITYFMIKVVPEDEEPEILDVYDNVL
ncbi:TPA: DUF362 domain-containing protein [Candidatus Poribacteria bacterium]|nr:DUF362 domain-containing protein [Candidatus Poribacteria bacterium]